MDQSISRIDGPPVDNSHDVGTGRVGIVLAAMALTLLVLLCGGCKKAEQGPTTLNATECANARKVISNLTGNLPTSDAKSLYWSIYNADCASKMPEVSQSERECLAKLSGPTDTATFVKCTAKP